MSSLSVLAARLLVMVAFGALAACGGTARPPTSAAVFDPQFTGSGLVTNEYAYRHPGDPADHLSPDWIVTSGSLFAQGGAGWTGPPDREAPNAQSSAGTDSAVFRLVSRLRNFGDVRVTCELFIQRHASVPGSEPHSYDGVHIWLRYAGETQLYTMSVMRWDGLVVIKRKTPGGPSNGGTYKTLASAPSAVPTRRWVPVTVQATNRRTGVELAIEIAGRSVVRVLDSSHQALTQPGSVGIRADNTEFKFRDFVARPVRR